ncbi:hypothetical protein [Gracilimonas sediminicola]|uniref:Uncharacterized protein n=1 Tax=Gracilimonas sediminicola TaxID=2952158 RepID=A0A9X2L3E5_9BACT|nr:hypothetical protein [Gracilimonas sediminicola]MCP9291636.1 hypothetical protein [Gracilimonas sediminicola]
MADVHEPETRSYNMSQIKAKDTKSGIIVSKFLDSNGFNMDEAAVQNVFHTQIDVIPRYKGDVENPQGGIRNVIPEIGDY